MMMLKLCFWNWSATSFAASSKFPSTWGGGGTYRSILSGLVAVRNFWEEPHQAKVALTRRLGRKKIKNPEELAQPPSWAVKERHSLKPVADN